MQAAKAQAKEERKQQLILEMQNKVPQRVLEWTNSIAMTKLGHSHYQSQRKRGPKPGPRKNK